MPGSQQPSALDAADYVTALSDLDWKTRWQACQTLGELNDKHAVRQLIETLDDDNQWVRIVAAEALGQIGDRAATQALILALRDSSMWVRRASVVALGKIGDEEAIPPLMNRLLDPPNNEWPEDLRDAIAKALGAIGATAIQTLIHALDDPDPWVSCAAARALGQIGAFQAITPLANLTKKKHGLVRSAATEALAQIADVRAVRAALTTDEAPRAFWKLLALKEIGESTISQLRILLDDPDAQVRAQAAEVLSHLGDEHGAEPLVAVRRAKPAPASRRRLKDSAKAPEPKGQAPGVYKESPVQLLDGLASLVASLRDPVGDVRLAAAEALGKAGDASIIPALSEALEDSDSRVRAAAARAIGEIGARPSW
jgi:HEAT repeat protein